MENISRIRQRPSVTGQLFLLAAALTSGSAGDIRDYRLDLKGPARLIDSVPANPVPTRVEIFLTGPGIYIDKSETTDRLSRRIPDLVITNSANLFGLVQALCDDETKERLPNVMKRYGLTYHFLLVYEENKSLIHFRVFETTDQSRVWWHVYPLSDPSFVYFNERIGGWIRAHLKIHDGRPSNSGGRPEGPPKRPGREESTNSTAPA